MPRDWTNFQVAEHIVNVLHGKAGKGVNGFSADAFSRLFDNFLKLKLSLDEITLEEAHGAYKARVSSRHCSQWDL